jgi:hypothetical protein
MTWGGRANDGCNKDPIMKTEPFRLFLAAVFAVAVVGAPALAEDQPAKAGSAPTDAKPGILQPQSKPDEPAKPALQGLHLKLGNVELKIRGPVIIVPDPASADPAKPDR